MEINKKLSRRERVYLQLAEMTQQITMNRIDHFDFKEYDATGIGKCLNITMNNTCMELNSLVKDGLVVKILGRPVYFFAREELAQVTGVRLPQCIWENYAQFREALNAPEIVQREEGFQTVEEAQATLGHEVGEGTVSLHMGELGLATVLLRLSCGRGHGVP